MHQESGLTIAMKRFFVWFGLAIAAATFVSCRKQQSEAEKNAEIERQVQQRLAAEHQDQQQQLDQRQADLDTREKALADKENVTPEPTRPESVESGTVESRNRVREPRERAINVGYSTFYNKLEPYGDWIETNDYGYVFHPREAEGSRRWRPYTNGHWVYTDAGWTWISVEPFGWATYHYGRWTRLREIGWVWVPGNQWAPAWVSWRKSNDYVGWAPLPPEARFDQRTGIRNWSDSYYDVGPDQYCFVASREFGAPRVEQTLLPPERNVTIINQTTNVTNITYNNTTIVNEGPNYDELRSISREPVPRYRLERKLNVDLTAGAPRPEVRGETVVIAAPMIAAPAVTERPPTVKQTIATATVDLGWAAIENQDEAKWVRQKMKSEVTPPPNVLPKKFVKAETTTSATTQGEETSTRSTSTGAAAAPSATASVTTASTSMPESTMTPPHRAATVAPTATRLTTSAAISTPSVSPTASQRHGRLLVPSATPSLRGTPSATPHATAAGSPTPSDKIPSTHITPPPEGSPLVPTGSPQEPMTRGHYKSQAQRFQPQTVQAMPSGSPIPSAATTSSSNMAAAPAETLAEKQSKQEKKEQKREEKREMKRERKAGNEGASPSTTP
jgi:hypothetical protein